MPFRIGQGIDIHPFIDGRPLVLGGVTIPSSQGLAGHSDADVLLHAVTDAVLGALGWGDIGQLFPNTDPRYSGADSKFFLSEVWSRAAGEGWRLVNCDSTVLAEAPKIMPYASAIRSQIAELFNASPEQIAIKATTAEKLGAIGRGEGMIALSVVLLERS